MSDADDKAHSDAVQSLYDEIMCSKADITDIASELLHNKDYWDKFGQYVIDFNRAFTGKDASKISKAESEIPIDLAAFIIVNIRNYALEKARSIIDVHGTD